MMQLQQTPSTIPQALGLSTREWVVDELGGYVRLSVEARREAVAELRDTLSQRHIADLLGVGHATIVRDIKALEAEPNGSIDDDEPPDTSEPNLEAEPNGSIDDDEPDDSPAEDDEPGKVTVGDVLDNPRRYIPAEFRDWIMMQLHRQTTNRKNPTDDVRF